MRADCGPHFLFRALPGLAGSARLPARGSLSVSGSAFDRLSPPPGRCPDRRQALTSLHSFHRYNGGGMSAVPGEEQVAVRSARLYLGHLGRCAAWLREPYCAELIDETGHDLREYRARLAHWQKPASVNVPLPPPSASTGRLEIRADGSYVHRIGSAATRPDAWVRSYGSRWHSWATRNTKSTCSQSIS